MSAYTPGPWWVEHLRDEGSLEIVARHPTGEVLVATTQDHDGLNVDGEKVANARLIAAAPELLEALLGVLRVADRATDEFDAARAAVEKARGER